MPVKRLNDKEISSIAMPADGVKQVLYFDDKLKGFGLRVTKESKTFIAESRVGGSTRRITIGKWGPITTNEARSKAKKLLAQMAEGMDPNKVKAAERARAMTLGEVFAEYKRRKTLRSKTVLVYDGAFKRCLSDWEAKEITGITRDQVEEKFRRLCAKEWQRKTSGRAQVSQAMRLLSALFNFAINVYEDSSGNPVILHNPVKRLSFVEKGWSRTPRRQGVIYDQELPAFHTAVSTLRNQTARDYLIFLLLTGLRRNEAAGLLWQEVDLVRRQITISGRRSKNKKPHSLPLSDYLHQLLSRRYEQNAGRSKFVFPGSGRKGDRCYSEIKSAYTRVGERMGKKFSPHDLRRTFITAAERLKIEPYALKALLNHSNSNDVTGGYIVIEVERLREPMEQITNFFLSQF